MATALTIAGSDSGGGAGIQADLKTFAAHGVFGTCAITAITAQNTQAVLRVVPLAADDVVAQIDAVASDIAIDAVKIGMLGSPDLVEAVAEALTRWRLGRIVVDPVMVAKSGHALLPPDAVVTILDRLLPVAAVVTPNRPEAETLTGRRITTLADVRDAARALWDRAGAAVVVKGGHAEGPVLVNVLFDGNRFLEFPTPRIDTRNTHGTGCTFASAIAAELAIGIDLPDAVEDATAYVAGAIRHAPAIGHGHGPLAHFWRLG